MYYTRVNQEGPRRPPHVSMSEPERIDERPRAGYGPDHVAAVDLGSNSFHMIIARNNGGELLVVDKLREMVQLAAGLDKRRVLTRKAKDRALKCLRRFGERLADMPPEAVRAVGTNTLRSARDAREFLAEAEEALGHPIETISGIEEARLIFQGVTQTLPDPYQRRLVVDIGGGSTELIVGEKGRPRAMESLYMGCVSMSRRHFADGNIDEEALLQAELDARRELEPIRERYLARGWDQAIGASGTVRSINQVIAAHRPGKREGITLKGLRKLRELVLNAGHVDALRLDGLNPDRRAIFPAGLVILLSIFETLEIARMTTADGTLREGLLYDLLGRMGDADVRARSVRWLADRYHVDWEHAERVERVATDLFDQVSGSWAPEDRVSRRLLAWASQLHEIGLDIAHQHYHKHGEYIVAQSDLFGFSREEQRMLATLVRAHRRKFPAAAISALPDHGVRSTERLAILLRLAVLCSRSRRDTPVPRLEAAKRRLTARFPSGWLADHPLTRADLKQEAGYLRGAGYKLDWD